MTLGDLRKLAIRQQTRIRFPLSGGMECVVNEKGVAQVPGLAGPPNFNLEQELVSVQTFQLDTLTSDPKSPLRTRAVRRDELATLASGSPGPETQDHDDE